MFVPPLVVPGAGHASPCLRAAVSKVLREGFEQRLQSSLGSAYTLERELGGGGMSRVFVAEEARLGRRVVVKVLAPELTEGMSAERFEREVRLAAGLQHPNVVPLLAAGERDGLAYYTMPYVDGESLRTHLARVGRLSVDAAVSVLRDVARALEYAHAHGVVHRDIKPDNILLAGSAAAVADFGIAKALHAARAASAAETATDTLTRAGTSMGTPAYMAPEQAAGDPDVDARADVYAWGVVAYELLAGGPLFVGPSAHQLVAAHIGERPSPLADRAPDAPPALCALVMRCLEKVPDRRPQNGGELLAALEATRKFRGPRRRVVFVLGMLTTLLVAAIVTLTTNRAPPPITAKHPVLAVLPFENVGAASADFAYGLTEEVRGRLTRISGLQVIGGKSTGQYKASTKSPGEIARELGATHLLTGTVRWEPGADGGRVRVSPELVRGSDQASVWAESIEGPMGDVFALQARVAERVADALNVALIEGERAAVVAPSKKNHTAVEAYLRGAAHGAWQNRFSASSRRAYTVAMEQAVASDPRFAAAHARLADSYLREQSFGFDSGGLLQRANASVDRAMKLDSTIVESQLALGKYLEAVDDPAGAYRALQAAKRIAPANPEVLMELARSLEGLGRYEESVAVYERVETLEPRWVDAPRQLSGAYDRLSRHEEAIATRERAIALSPAAGFDDVFQAGSYLLWRADTLAARHVLMNGPLRPAMDELTRMPSHFAGRAIWLSVLPPAVLHAKDTITLAGYARGDWGTPDLYHLMKARHFALTKHPKRARAHADSVIALLEPVLRRGPGTSVLAGLFTQQAALAEAYGYAERTTDAARMIDQYVATKRARRDKSALQLPYGLVTAAFVDVMIGRRELAVSRLEEALRLPSGQWISRSLLRADPSWAPLRGHPGFERLLATGA